MKVIMPLVIQRQAGTNLGIYALLANHFHNYFTSIL